MHKWRERCISKGKQKDWSDVNKTHKQADSTPSQCAVCWPPGVCIFPSLYLDTDTLVTIIYFFYFEYLAASKLQINIFDHESKQLIKMQKLVAINTIHFLVHRACCTFLACASWGVFFLEFEIYPILHHTARSRTAFTILCFIA